MTLFSAFIVFPVAAIAPSLVVFELWGDRVFAQDASPLPAWFDQNYQTIEVAGPESTASPPSGADASVSSVPENTLPSSLSDPIWVMPEQPAAPPPRVTVPEIRKPPPAPSKPSATPANPAKAPSTDTSPDLVVTATSVAVEGVDAELQEVVRKTIKTQPGGQTSKAQLQQDVAEILDTGFFATANVTSRPNPNGISVVFQVTPTVVQSIQLSGAQALTQTIAEELFKPQLGATINPTELTQAVQRINQWYAQNGYVLARVLTLEPTRDGTVIVTVAEGAVGDVQVRFVNKEGKTVDERGQPLRHRTQIDFVRRQIKLQPGQVFQDSVVREDLKRLTELGIFDSISVSFEGDARRTTVVYNVTEGKSRGFNFGGGYNTDLGVFGSVSYQDRNFGGLAQTVTGSVLVGSRDVQFDARFVSPYRDTDPNTPGYGVDLFRRQGLSRVFEDPYRLPNGSRVRERRLGGGVNLSRPLGPGWMGTLGLSYTNVSIRDREGDTFATDSQGRPLTLSDGGIDDLYALTFNAVRDQRDNPVNPSSGSILSLSTQQYFPIGRGHVFGNRLDANYSQYFPVNIIKGLKGDQPQVLAFNLQGGTYLGDLPPYNAFILGGVNSVRGYDFGEVATSRSYVQGSVEYRFPIYKFIGGVVFADFGSSLGTQDGVPGEPGEVRDLPGSGFGAGIGLRFNSPIGIIRTELGINNEGGTQFHFGFGLPF
ncbi:MAG: BamA/TamA family outer membrane protein [Leptolyngbyaceae cyanobacterium HOT.MB2.61]|nr:BamA/TamA family outer membrane protein [Leptolyngbyaceae cyanobacterium HOT.MB2.61]